MTGAEIIDEVCGPIGYDPTDSEDVARALRWINEAQYDIASKDWPELLNTNSTFTTDGSETYDLTSEIDTNFYRIVDKSVRIGTRNMVLRDKSFIDQYDPNRTFGSNAVACGIVNRVSFWLWPAQSSGETVTLDWVSKPVSIDESTTESGITYYPERHSLIVEGALCYGYRYNPDYGMDATTLKRAFQSNMLDMFRKTQMVKAKSTQIMPIAF